MCGIAAQFGYRGAPVDRAALTRMQQCMITRGPDANGQWVAEEGHAGLAHQRLSIIDLSERGAQPMKSGDTTAVVSFNGEIYNYQALRTALQAEGYHFQSDSDTEVLLHLYDQKGADLVHDLRGMFAFALYDVKRDALLLARDPYGIKPLYYADDGAIVSAASQVKALRELPKVDTTPNPAGQVGFYLFGHVPEPHTWYRGIHALPAGHTLWVTRKGAQTPQCYADVAAAYRHAENGVHLPDVQPEELLRDALSDSVQHHLTADVPVGLFLSAGL
ncbi:MAG: asparagine synthetase B, partial [Bacteroidetes bacterium]|nr:asparagine synthetase B [Bacteroidota bacterium]